jgi:hypothetical protein
VDARHERIGRNEALFREVNERIRDVSSNGDIEFLCECGDENCTQQIRLTRAEYQEVRSHPARFAIARGHEIADVELVVAENERFAVVEKLAGEPHLLAERTDPRSR